jgi:hypothetical protein
MAPTRRLNCCLKAKSVNGVNYAIVYDGDQVVWENVPGAAEQFK